MELYENVKLVLGENKISLDELIKKTNLKQSTIYHIMKNKNNFNNAKMSNILQILSVVGFEIVAPLKNSDKKDDTKIYTESLSEIIKSQQIINHTTYNFIEEQDKLNKIIIKKIFGLEIE